MLTIHIITVGKDKERWITDQIDHFRKLISKYARLELTTVPESKYGKNIDIEKALAAEAEAIKSKLKGGYLFILDNAGKKYTTEALAAEIQKLQVQGHSLMEFVIGGPFGLSSAIKSTRQKPGSCPLSLSPLTMSHQISRVVLLEQLYRVLNLNAGGSYHK